VESRRNGPQLSMRHDDDDGREFKLKKYIDHVCIFESPSSVIVSCHTGTPSRIVKAKSVLTFKKRLDVCNKWDT